MRRMLALAILGATLSLSASAALAGGNFDYNDRHPDQFQQAQVTTQPYPMDPAGPVPAPHVWLQDYGFNK